MDSGYHQLLLSVICFLVMSSTLAQISNNTCILARVTIDDAIALDREITVHVGDNILVPCPLIYSISDSQPPLPFWRLDYVNKSKPVFLRQGAFPRNFYEHKSSHGRIRSLNISQVGKDLNSASVACCLEFFSIDGICEANSTIIHVVAIHSTPNNTPFTRSTALQPRLPYFTIILCIALTLILLFLSVHICAY